MSPLDFPHRPALVTRRAEPLALEGVRVTELAGLRALLEREAPGAHVVVSDLSLGAWRGQWTAGELSRQLGLQAPRAVQPRLPTNTSAGARPDYADGIGRLVDTESAGDAVVAAALDAAERVLRAAAERPPVVFVVIAPRPGRAWEPEDAWFVRFLAQGAPRARSRFLLAAGEEAVEPPSCRVTWRRAPGAPAAPLASDGDLAALIPGVLEPGLAAAPAPGSGLPPLGDGSVVVEPAARRDGEAAEYDRLARAAAPGWLRAYALCWGTAGEADVGFLCEEAAERFAEGGYGIAHRLLERAREAARHPLARAAVELQAAGMRIALMRFAEAAAAPDPAPGLPPGMRGVLLQCKAWGLVMTDRPREAEPRFQEAIELLRGEEPTRYFLYLLNITALNKLRLGQADAALALEKEIERALAEAPRPDWHLGYINAINQARLYRRLRDFESAERYYARAFAGNLGVRSPSDLVYMNVCWAQLAEDRGEPRGAFLGWLRAAMHWVSARVPEALAPRVTRVLLEGAPPSAEEVPEGVSVALLARLRTAAARAGMDEPPPAAGPPLFRAPDAPPAGAVEYAIGAPGWSVLALSEGGNGDAPPFQGEAYDALRAWVGGFVTAHGRLARERRWTFLVDARYGTEMAIDLPELLDTAARWGAEHVVFAGAAARLAEEEARRLRGKARVHLGPALDRLRLVEGGLEAHFKRYRPPVLVPPAGVRLLDLIGPGTTLAELEAAGRGDEVLEPLHELLEARVVATSPGGAG